eukprot:m51a1_g513 putative 2-aminoadipate aminotransferase + Phosphopantothenate-cysteine ligase + Aldolase (1074) ;mRNA; r:317445-321015
MAVSFAGGSLGRFDALEHLLERSIRSVQPSDLLSYSDPLGEPDLRHEIVRVHETHAGAAWPQGARAVVTSGGQQALALALAHLARRPRPAPPAVLVQQPCYFGALRALRALLPTSELLPWETPAQLLALMRPGAVVYASPAHAADSAAAGGELMGPEQLAGVAARALELGCDVVEDRPYDLSVFSSPVVKTPSLFALAPARVLLVGGLSKVLGPGLRVGFVAHCGGDEVERGLKSAKLTCDGFTSTLCQRAALAALRELPEALPAMRERLATSCAAMVGRLEAEFGPGRLGGRVSWEVPTAGVFLRFSWDAAHTAGPQRLVELCAERGVELQPSAFSCLDGKARPYTRLNFVANDRAAMEAGVARLAEACRLMYSEQQQQPCPAPVAAAVPAQPSPRGAQKRQLHVFITSGGTSVLIDGVRTISNLSQGVTGASIAEAFLLAGHRVTYLHARSARRPFLRSMSMSLDADAAKELERLRALRATYEAVKSRLREIEYYTFEEYYAACERVLSAPPGERPDAGIFAAAVSDYGPKEHNEGTKLSSDCAEMTIKLGLLPKVISHVKRWHPGLFLVAFKLLVDVSLDELVDVGYKSVVKVHANLVVANTVVAGTGLRERLTVIITPEKSVMPTTTSDLPRHLTEVLERRISSRHYHSEVAKDSAYLQKHAEQIAVFSSCVSRCLALGLFLPFLSTHATGESVPEFGFVAVRVPSGGFLITARGSSKSHADPAVFVESVDTASRVVRVSSAGGEKASLNANVAAGLFKLRPDVNVILHAHVFPGARTWTENDYAPGTQEDYDEVVGTASRSGSDLIGLKNHGIICVGKSMDAILDELLKHNVYTTMPEMYDLSYARFQESKRFYEIVANNAQDKHGSVLDLASGTGEVAKVLSSMGYSNITLCDSNAGMLKVAKSKLGGSFDYHVCALESLKLPSKYHTVVCRQSINYVASTQSLADVFCKIRSVMMPGGVFIFNTPNFSEDRSADYTKTVTWQGNSNGWTLSQWEANELCGRALTHTQQVTARRLPGGEVIESRIVFDMNRFTLFTEREFIAAFESAAFKCYQAIPHTNSLYFVVTA